MPCRRTLLDLVAVCVLAALAPRTGLAASPAQSIATDGSLGPAAVALTGPNYAITAGLGKQVGGNLFHSFQRFGLTTGESAIFSGPAAINNVISRVTGGSQSSIDGAIKSTITGANLYLINPSGIVFGPNAAVNVTGAFHASTADYLKMVDGARFQATNPSGSTLSAAPPAAFGFLNSKPAAITVNRSSLGPVPGTLGLVGGPPVTISNGATLTAPAGTIHIASVAGTGEVPVDPRNTAALTVTNFGPINISGATLDVSNQNGVGPGGSVFIHSGALTIDAGSEINADNYGPGIGGQIVLHGDSGVSLTNGANVHSVAMGAGGAANIAISAVSSGTVLVDNSNVQTGTNAAGGGSIAIVAGQLTLQNFANVLAQSNGTTTGGAISASVTGALTLTSGASLGTIANADGNAGDVAVTAGQVTIDMSVGAAQSMFQGIASQTSGAGNAGNVTVTAGTLSILTNGEIFSATVGSGNSGGVTVGVSGQLRIDGSGEVLTPPVGPTGIFSEAAGGSGAAGTVSVTAGTLSIVKNGVISTSTFGLGNAGDTTVAISGQLTIDGSGGNLSTTGIFSQATPGSSGAAGTVSVSAGTLSILNNGEISATTFSSGNAGSVTVTVPGQMTIDGSREVLAAGRTGIFSQTTSGSSGAAGSVSVSAGTLVIANDGTISSKTLGSGNGGGISVATGDLRIVRDGTISTDSGGTGSGNAGSVSVNVAGPLTIDGMSQTSVTGISSESTGGSDGNSGDVKVFAGTLSIGDGGAISTSTGGSGAGGTVLIAVGGNSVLSGGALIASGTSGPGKGGRVEVTAQGPVTLTDAGSGIVASATSMASGNAGSVVVTAPVVTLVSGGAIASTTAGTGDGGSVTVTTPGALVLNGMGDPGTQIAASAIGPQSGSGGAVKVGAASLVVEGEAEIASSTAGPRSGGNVSISVAGDIVLPDPGPQITARSTGSGDAGSITMSAARLLLGHGAAISTEALTSTANGGNITLSIGDFLYLTGSEVTTSVKGQTGNGGNITIDPQFAILDHSNIIAQAIAGHGGNITITAGSFIQSADSLVSATSQLGVSGVVTINGPLVDLNGTLVVLSSELRNAAALTREACAARGNRPQSSLVEAGRGGVAHDTDATLPALYIAGRDLESGPLGTASSGQPGARQITLQLTMRCR